MPIGRLVPFEGNNSRFCPRRFAPHQTELAYQLPHDSRTRNQVFRERNLSVSLWLRRRLRLFIFDGQDFVVLEAAWRVDLGRITLVLSDDAACQR